MTANCPCCFRGTIREDDRCDRCGVAIPRHREVAVTAQRAHRSRYHTPKEPNSFWDYVQSKMEHL